MRRAALFAAALLLQGQPLPEARLAEVRSALDRAIAAGTTPGAVYWCGLGAQERHWAQGRRALVPAPEPMDEATVFDAASLTKAVATLPCILLLHDRGRLDLDAPVQAFLPEFPHRGITVRHLLTHTSGLPAGLPKDPARMDWAGYAEGIRRACACAPDAAPGTAFRYSDVNFILLGEVVHRVSGKPLDVFAREEVFRPLGMADTGFRPPEALRPRIAPTERDPQGRMLRGVVHDPTARRMGGVAGHAGLFTTAADLARYARFLLRGGPLLKPETLRLARSGQTPPGLADRRGLGWDLQTAYSHPRGRWFSPASYGHTGFTGVALWLDPEADAFFILLTTRLHPEGQGVTKGLYAEIGTLTGRAFGLDREAPLPKP